MRSGRVSCCYKCNDRTCTCHATCVKYIAEAAKNADSRDKRLMVKIQCADYYNCKYDTIRKNGGTIASM